MCPVWALVALGKARVLFKEVDELLDPNVVEGFLHGSAIHRPEAAFHPDLLVANSACHGTLWNAVQARKRTPGHQVTR